MKASIYIPKEPEMLIDYLIKPDENFSSFVSRLITEEGKRQGYEVVTSVVKKGE